MYAGEPSCHARFCRPVLARLGSSRAGESVPNIDHSDGEHQIGRLLLAEVRAHLCIDSVGHMPVRDERHGLGPGDRRAFALGLDFLIIMN